MANHITGDWFTITQLSYLLVGHYRLVMTCPKYLHKSVYISPKNKTVDIPKYFLSSYL